jgi:hypothetical protein
MVTLLHAPTVFRKRGANYSTNWINTEENRVLVTMVVISTSVLPLTILSIRFQIDVECYRCHKKGHYSNKCPDFPSSNRGRRQQCGRGRGRGGRGGNYYLWVPDEEPPQTSAAATIPPAQTIIPAPPPPGYVQPPSSGARDFLVLLFSMVYLQRSIADQIVGFMTRDVLLPTARTSRACSTFFVLVLKQCWQPTERP